MEAGVKNIAITAGASAPEILVDNLIKFFKQKYGVAVNYVNYINENVQFHPPKIIRDLKKLYGAEY